MKASKVYQKAALLLEMNAPNGYGRQTCEYACESIEAAGGTHEMKEAMSAMFNDDGSYAYLSAFNGDVERERPIRILALCFMACISEDSE